MTATTPDTRAYAKLLNRIGWTLVIFIGVYYALFSMYAEFMAIFQVFSSSTAYVIVDGVLSTIIYVASFLIPAGLFFVMSRREKTEPIRWEVKLPPAFPLMILTGLGVITAAAIINSLFCNIIGYVGTYEAVYYDNPAIIVMYMTIALAPAIAEEILFRGVIFSHLRPYGRTQAVLISAALFALMHQDISQYIYTFFAGICMAFMYELTGSIWCCTIYHMLNNELSVIYDVIYSRYGGGSMWLLNLFDGVMILLGAISLVILIVYHRKKLRSEEKLPPRERVESPDDEAVDLYTRPLSGVAVKKNLCAPGILVFVALSLLSAVGSYVMVLFQNIGGGL